MQNLVSHLQLHHLATRDCILCSHAEQVSKSEYLEKVPSDNELIFPVVGNLTHSILIVLLSLKVGYFWCEFARSRINFDLTHPYPS